MTSKRYRRVLRILDGISVMALVVWMGRTLLHENVFGKTPWPDSIVDYRIIYEASREVVQMRSYPANYPYPPSAVILQWLPSTFTFSVSAAVWMTLTAMAGVACWTILAFLLGLHRQPGGMVLVLLAYASSEYFWVWDLSKQNSNVLFLAFALAGVAALRYERALVAGFFIALSFSFKLFSVLLFPYLLWKRRWRTLGWALAFTVSFWILLPMMVVGPTGTRQIYEAWWPRFHTAADSGSDQSHPILISLDRSIDYLTDGNAGSIALSLTAARVIWMGVLIATIASRRRTKERDDSFGLLADASILILAPIACSPYLEPYHPVAFAIPSLLLLVAASDRQNSTRLRWCAAALFLLALPSLSFFHPWNIRGLVCNLKLLVGAGGAAFIAWRRCCPADSIGSPQALPIVVNSQPTNLN